MDRLNQPSEQAMPQITEVVESLKSEKIPLTFYLDEQSRSIARGYITKIDLIDQFVYMKKKELSPAENYFDMGAKLLARCYYQRTLFQFAMRVSHIEDKFIRFNLPEEFIANQRRQAFRINVEEGEMTVEDFEAGKHTGLIHDLSVLGISAFYDEDLTEHFLINDTIDHCEINLNDDIALNCQLQLKRIDFETHTEKTFLAGEFKSLSSQEEVVLSKYINSEQGKRLKRYIFK